MDSLITNQPVVIDNGSGIIKAGFAGDQVPKCRFPNFIGAPKHVRVMAGALEGNVFYGPKAEEHRGLLNLRYPIEHGIVTNWNDMEQVWQYIFSKPQLDTFPEEHPVLLTEAPLNPRRNREKSAEIFFETFNVPALFVSMQAVLSLYATGRTTGVVLDAGDGVTHAVPVYEGFAMPHSIMRVDVAGRRKDKKPGDASRLCSCHFKDGNKANLPTLFAYNNFLTRVLSEEFPDPEPPRDVTRYLKMLLRREGHNFRSSAEFQIVREIKEKSCYISANPVKEESLAIDADKSHFVLPDGNRIDLGHARFRAPEVLFRPDLIGEECEGLHQVLNYSIMRSDMDLRKTLYLNIVLSGGSTLFEGFGARLLSEVKKLAPRDIKIRISAPPERLYSTWIGGSILASLDAFKRMWLSKRTYDEEGPNAIHKKMF